MNNKITGLLKKQEEEFDRTFAWFHGTDLAIKTIDTHDAAKDIKSFLRQSQQQLIEGVIEFLENDPNLFQEPYTKGLNYAIGRLSSLTPLKERV